MDRLANQPGNFSDYGLLFEAANDANADCRSRAAVALYNKLGAEPATTWTGFLAGAYVTYVMATAMEASAHGNLYGDLDARVRDVANTYAFDFYAGDPCGFANGRWAAGNNCMDDYTIGASGWAWIAAFRRMTARDWQQARGDAITKIQESFNRNDSVCMNMPGRALDPSTGPCNAYPWELGAGGARVVSLNHGNQTPAYGIGLMTSIAAAFVALDAIYAPVNTSTELDSNHHAVIDALWAEGQASTDVYGNFSRTACVKPNSSSPTGFDTNWPCWDQIGYESHNYEDANGLTPYRAKFYPMKNFYSTYNLGTGDPNLYQFDQFDDTFDIYPHKWFGPGRKHTYSTLASQWINPANRAALTGNSEYKMNIRMASNSWLFSATNGGGSTVNANVTAPNTWEMFWVYDMNGAQFWDGDPITIKTYNGQYLRADNGGGSNLTAAGTSTDPYSRFTIVKLGGSSGPLIAHGDTFALRTYDGWHYVTAINGGGGTVAASATGFGNNETLYFNRPNHY